LLCFFYWVFIQWELNDKRRTLAATVGFCRNDASMLIDYPEGNGKTKSTPATVL
jgi:hypothetical protein